jgi:hypothetical protein
MEFLVEGGALALGLLLATATSRAVLGIVLAATFGGRG